MKKVLMVCLTIFCVCGCLDTDVPLVQEPRNNECQIGVLTIDPIELFGGIGIAKVKTSDNRVLNVYFNIGCDDFKKGDEVLVMARLINGNQLLLFGSKKE